MLHSFKAIHHATELVGTARRYFFLQHLWLLLEPMAITAGIERRLILLPWISQGSHHADRLAMAIDIRMWRVSPDHQPPLILLHKGHRLLASAARRGAL